MRFRQQQARHCLPRKQKHKTGDAPKCKSWPLAGDHSSVRDQSGDAPCAAHSDGRTFYRGHRPSVAAGEDTAPESLRVNNGFDLTRPQTAFEVRGLDETSSNDTSETNRAQMALRSMATAGASQSQDPDTASTNVRLRPIAH